jgi:hypothetical protein
VAKEKEKEREKEKEMDDWRLHRISGGRAG